jgi:hypothetical protein
MARKASVSSHAASSVHFENLAQMLDGSAATRFTMARMSPIGMKNDHPEKKSPVTRFPRPEARPRPHITAAAQPRAALTIVANHLAAPEPLVGCSGLLAGSLFAWTSG